MVNKFFCRVCDKAIFVPKLSLEHKIEIMVYKEKFNNVFAVHVLKGLNPEITLGEASDLMNHLSLNNRCATCNFILEEENFNSTCPACNHLNIKW